MAQTLDYDQLLISIVEHLKLPLVNIARESESNSFNNILGLAENSLRLIDGYILGLNQSLIQSELDFEPVSVSEVLADTAHSLHKIAKIYDCQLELKIEGRFGPVMSRRTEMKSALALVGQTIIESNSERNKSVVLSAYKTGGEIIAGIFSSDLAITNDSLKKAVIGSGKIRQGIPDFSHTPIAGLLVADMLLERLSTKLKIVHHKKLSGLASNFITSKQLQFV